MGATIAELRDHIAHATGSENFYKLSPLHFGMVCSDGVKYIADNAGGGAYWLVDIIGSYQPQLRKIALQCWELTVHDNKSADMVCTNGNGKELIAQHIPWTDFPLNSIKLWVENGICYLPSER